MSLDRVLPGRGFRNMDWSGITLPPHIALCGICNGKGQYEQTYTAGCGMGSFRSVGRCDHCEGTGLRLTLDNPFVDTSRMKIDAGDLKPLIAQLDAKAA